MARVTMYYNNIFVGEVLTNMSLTVDDILELVSFDEIKFMKDNDLEDIDYGNFSTSYST